MEKETMYERLTSLEGWDSLLKKLAKAGIDNERIAPRSSMVEIKLEGCYYGVNCLRFYNNHLDLTDIDFVLISTDNTQSTRVHQHYNVPKNQIMDHIIQVLGV